MSRAPRGLTYSMPILLTALFAFAAAPPVAAGPSCDAPTILPGTPFSMIDGHLAGPGDAEYYSIFVRAGENLVVQLRHPVLPLLLNWGIVPDVCVVVDGFVDTWPDGFRYGAIEDGVIIFVVFAEMQGGDFSLAWSISNGF